MGLSRRLFLGGLLAGTAAPAIVRASSLMPIWVPKPLTTADGLRILMDWQRLRDAQIRTLLDQAQLASHPQLLTGELGQVDRFTFVGIDPARPGSDATVWQRWSTDRAGQICVDNINPLETYKPWR